MSDDMSNARQAGTYDPDQHENQLIAVYETTERAEEARDLLVSTGVPTRAIQIVQQSGTGADMGSTAGAPIHDEGVWGAIKSIFAPDEEATAYHHAVHQGHAMLVVTAEAGVDRNRVIDVIERTEPVDFDAKLQEWQQSGYDYSRHPAAAGIGAAAGSRLGAATGMAEMPTPGLSGSSGTIAGQSAAGFSSAGMGAPASGLSGQSPETIKVMEERLRVGKREVAAGAVRVRSYVVERPVEEQVRLREERVSLERRPVDRAATAADLQAFGEQTIEARATTEQAVVSKEARVIEEIGIRKDVDERTETVRDTVRKTEVEVDDQSTAPRTGVAGDPRLPRG